MFGVHFGLLAASVVSWDPGGEHEGRAERERVPGGAAQLGGHTSGVLKCSLGSLRAVECTTPAELYLGTRRAILV